MYRTVLPDLPPVFYRTRVPPYCLPREGFQSVNLPEELMERIDAFIAQNLARGYRTRPDVIKQALRDFLDREEAIRLQGKGPRK